MAREPDPRVEPIRRALAALGLEAVETIVAQHILGEASFDAARARGLLDRWATSQLMVISDGAYASGLRRIEAERPRLRADLRLHATTGWKDAVRG